jgi:hypothetical protein
MSRKTKGFVLPIVITIILILVITGMAILTLAEQESILGAIEANKAKAFYLAEAGLAKMTEKLQKPITGTLSEVLTESLEGGSYRVEFDNNSSPCYITSTGISGTVHKKVRVQANFLAAPFENAVYAANKSGGAWALELRGTGSPVANSGREKSGRDVINGNIFVNGDVFLREQSQVGAAPAPNKWKLDGDVEATGSISVLDSAKISGKQTNNAEIPDTIDLISMDYAHNNTHNVSQIFTDAGVSSGRLPSGNALRDVFMKNPSDRSTECSSTTGDDYFIEPSSGFIEGTEKTAATPVHLGNDRVYYIDGDVWVHSNVTYGFLVDGKVTIVATGNIHISDNIEYKDKQSMLGLVSLGKYDSSGNLVSGGNIYFGDPRYGTMYTVSGMMFAANDFLFNTDAVTHNSAEPTSGFTINGSFAAQGQVKVERDWYTSGTTARPAHYDAATSQWIDSLSGAVLTSTQVSSIKHYQMIVNYDDRVRGKETRPPGLPKGGTNIFAGFSNWEEL